MTATRFAAVDGDIIRALPAALELRDTGSKAGSGTTMFGHFAVFNRFTEIDSMWEGNFMEQIAPGAFRKTFRENLASIRVLAEHGRDPSIGNRALGPIDILREDKTGAYYEVPLVDAQDVRDLVLPRLRANLYGASFRFRVLREDVNQEPEASEQNPKGLPERTVKEAKVFEFGPVTFPAYAEASAGARSLTDEFVPEARLASERQLLLARLEIDPELRTAILGRSRGWRRDVMRLDAEDMGILAEMVGLGTEYIDEQDEAEDAKNIPVMEGVLQSLNSLMNVEAAENEPDEAEDENAADEEPGTETRKSADESDTDAAPEPLATTPLTKPVPMYGLNKRKEKWRL